MSLNRYDLLSFCKYSAKLVKLFDKNAQTDKNCAV